MSKTAFASCLAVLSLLLLLFPRTVRAEPHLRKIHVRELEVNSCIPTSATALRVRINEQIRPDILEKRGLAYEDLSAYTEVTKWNPEEFDVQETRNALTVLAKFDIKAVLWFSLSCLPNSGSGPPRYLLAAKLTDIDAMNVILACPDTQAAIRDKRRVCHVDGDVFDAVSFTSVEIDNFDDFRTAVQTLLSRLLHVPEISFGSPQTEFDASEEISLPFTLRHNDGKEAGYNGAPAEARAYELQQDVVELPNDLTEHICRTPSERWAQISCSAGFRGPNCDGADAIKFTVKSLIHQRVVSVSSNTKEGGDRISFRAPPHAQTYLVRAEAIAKEKAGEIPSTPIYECINVRMRPFYIAVSSRLGVPQDVAGRSDHYPPAGMVAPSVGVDLSIIKHLYGAHSRWLPATRGALTLGYTTLAGTYPCPARDFPVCDPGKDLYHFNGKIHFAQSSTGEMRLSLRPEVLRISKVSLREITEVGLGIESLHTSSGAAFKNDGLYGVAIAGLGGSLSFSSILGLSTWAGDVSVGFLWQTRQRLASAVVVHPATEKDSAYIDAPGVPDTVETSWFFVELAFSP